MHFTLQLECVLSTELKFVKLEKLVYEASEILATLMLCRISEGISEGCRLSDPWVCRMKVIGTTNENCASTKFLDFGTVVVSKLRGRLLDFSDANLATGITWKKLLTQGPIAKWRSKIHLNKLHVRRVPITRLGDFTLTYILYYCDARPCSRGLVPDIIIPTTKEFQSQFRTHSSFHKHHQNTGWGQGINWPTYFLHAHEIRHSCYYLQVNQRPTV